ncbi:unnamed protein product (mitochondrion) [Plasmodiophora brassicae]|uniref:Transmembrane 9 superfamily member n=1 Tax=Plasmodiophora brassicae TaxID=37360 RepID=A0A3P3Y189_PLABS|nr:unnamed protein product [Plasmodiophora brassicae]
MRSRAATLLLVAWAAVVLADESTNEYEDGETVVVWVNKLGPNHNPQETYRYDSLPFCKPAEKVLAYKSDSMGSLLEGNELTDSGIVVQFKRNRKSSTICEQDLSQLPTVMSFVNAVQKNYWYQMYIDELPVWGLVGEMSQDEPDDPNTLAYMYSHRKLSISFNGNRIIHVNLTSDRLVPLLQGKSFPMTFEVEWIPTTELFEDRFDHYLDVDFFEHQIHWFSIFNSFMMVLFLCGLVVLILMRTLRNDYAKYSLEDDTLDIDTVGEESGWKQVHGDVFRAPYRLPLFAALIGIGHQLFSLVILLCFFAIAGNLYKWRGLLLNSAITAWVLTSIICGFSSGSYYKRCGGRQWKLAFGLALGAPPVVIGCLMFVLNTVAVMYSSSAALPFLTVLGVIAIWLVLCVPLTLFGTLIGRNVTKAGDFPCRVSNMRRPIPLGPWYSRGWFLALLGGILPFGSIFIEMHFILTAIWNYKFYYVFGFLLLVFAILAIVTMCVTVVLTYFLLNSEDYRWHWVAYGSGGSTGIYVFLYCLYYFAVKTRMSGLLQTAFYFGYSTLLALCIGLICGSVAFSGAHLFVSRIYKDIKSD